MSDIEAAVAKYVHPPGPWKTPMNCERPVTRDFGWCPTTHPCLNCVPCLAYLAKQQRNDGARD